MARRGDRNRDDATSGAKFQHAIARAYIGEARQQNRVDSETITVTGLRDSQRTPEDCIGRCFEDIGSHGCG